MRIVFLWDWKPEYSQSMSWKDGLAAALRELMRRGHDVTVLVPGDEDDIIRHPYFDIHVSKDVPKLVKELNPNVILHWADMTRPNAKPLFDLGIPQAICFAGGEPLGENYPFFAHVFVESQVYKDVFDNADVPCSIAFGTNTELFKPIRQNKLIDTLFPATFALWKRHDLYAVATQGLRSVACGYIYPDHEQECWEECLNLGATILPHVSADVLHYLYAASRVCVITSNSSGGSQRTVLEAMAMNLPLVVTDSDKFHYTQGRDDVWQVDPAASAIRDVVDFIIDNNITVNTRDYILENWSEFTYCDALEKGLQELCVANTTE